MPRLRACEVLVAGHRDVWVFGGGEVRVVGAGHDGQGLLCLGEVSGEGDDGDLAGACRVGAQGDVGDAERDGDG